MIGDVSPKAMFLSWAALLDMAIWGKKCSLTTFIFIQSLVWYHDMISDWIIINIFLECVRSSGIYSNPLFGWERHQALGWIPPSPRNMLVEDLKPRYSPSWKEEAEKARAAALGEQIATEFRQIVDQVSRGWSGYQRLAPGWELWRETQHGNSRCRVAEVREFISCRICCTDTQRWRPGFRHNSSLLKPKGALFLPPGDT